jgi:hypothetical protein
LAESLCGRAKKAAKDLAKKKEEGLTPSCLMFHKVQDSFVEDFEKIAERELRPDGLNFEFGPYYLNEQEGKWTIQNLLDKTMLLKSKDGNAVKSHLREWLGMLFVNTPAANQKIKRLLLYNESINKNDKKQIIKKLELDKYVEAEKVKHIPFHDVLSLLSLQNKEEENHGKQL